MKIGMLPILEGNEARFTEICIASSLRKHHEHKGEFPQLIKSGNALKFRPFEKVDNMDMGRKVKLLQNSINTLYDQGAGFAFIPHHLPQAAFEQVMQKSPLKIINTANCVVDACRKRGFDSVCILASSPIVQLYQDAFKEVGISPILPVKKEQEVVDLMITEAKETSGIPKNAPENLQATVSKLLEKNNFSALLIANLELLTILPQKFTQVERLNPFKLLADKVVQIATDPFFNKSLYR